MTALDKSQITGAIGELQEEIIRTIRSRGGEATMEALAATLLRHNRDGKPSSTLRHSVGGLYRRGILAKEKRGGEWWYSEPEMPVQFGLL